MIADSICGGLYSWMLVFFLCQVDIASRPAKPSRNLCHLGFEQDQKKGICDFPTFTNFHTNFRRSFFGLNPSRAWSLHTWISGENSCESQFVLAMWELEIAVLNQTFSMGTGVEDDWIFFPYRKAKWSSLQRKGNLKCFKTMFYPLEN